MKMSARIAAFVVLSIPLLWGQHLPGDSKAVLLASQAQLALTGGVPVSDVLLNADAEWIVGGTKVSGTATLRAKGTTKARLDIVAGEVRRTETRNDSNGPDGQWAALDGTRHAMALHNCWGPAAWFSPHAIVQALSSSEVVARHVGRETRGTLTVDRVQSRRANTEKNLQLAQDLEKLSTADIFLDSATHLPTAVVFNTHPDNDYGRDIPIEIRFSDYRAVNGVMVPFRIQRFMQGTLNLDLTITTATINSGLAESEFALQ